MKPTRRDVFSFNAELYVVSRFELRVAHMVLFHVHKGNIRVCLGEAVAPSECFIVALVLLLPGKKLPELFNIPLQRALPLAASMHERKVCLALQSRQQGTRVSCNNTILAAQLWQQLFQLRIQTSLIFVRALLPHKAVLVGVGFNLCPVYKQMLKSELTKLMQMMYKLAE